ncbi:hypothetical protein GQ457_12G003380 [Hibiscus cannabinus]
MAEISRRDWKIVGREKDRFLFLYCGKERLREWLKFQGVDRFVFYCFSLPFVYNSFQVSFYIAFVFVCLLCLEEFYILELNCHSILVRIRFSDCMKKFESICIINSFILRVRESRSHNFMYWLAEIASLARVVSRNPGFLVAINQDLSISCCEVR